MNKTFKLLQQKRAVISRNLKAAYLRVGAKWTLNYVLPAVGNLMRELIIEQGKDPDYIAPLVLKKEEPKPAWLGPPFVPNWIVESLRASNKHTICDSKKSEVARKNDSTSEVVDKKEQLSELSKYQYLCSLNTKSIPPLEVNDQDLKIAFYATEEDQILLNQDKASLKDKLPLQGLWNTKINDKKTYKDFLDPKRIAHIKELKEAINKDHTEDQEIFDCENKYDELDNQVVDDMFLPSEDRKFFKNFDNLTQSIAHLIEVSTNLPSIQNDREILIKGLVEIGVMKSIEDATDKVSKLSDNTVSSLFKMLSKPKYEKARVEKPELTLHDFVSGRIRKSENSTELDNDEKKKVSQ